MKTKEEILGEEDFYNLGTPDGYSKQKIYEAMQEWGEQYAKALIQSLVAHYIISNNLTENEIDSKINLFNESLK